jgi:hypothetical protein
MMVVQIVLGSVLLLVSIIIAGASFYVFELLLDRARAWLHRRPHRPKLVIVLCFATIWILGLVTIGVWLWAATFWGLGIFRSLEESVYFSLVAFTTLGFGDILLPVEWRLLAGMAAVNGLLNIGFVTALTVETLRRIRVAQMGAAQG